MREKKIKLNVKHILHLSKDFLAQTALTWVVKKPPLSLSWCSLAFHATTFERSPGVPGVNKLPHRTQQ